MPLPEDGPQLQRDIKLPQFWAARPNAWFTYIESRFRLRNIVEEQAKFDHVLSALPEDVVGQVLDLVEMAPADNPYTFLKGRILETHQLSDYEKWDQLMKVPPMGGRKPSQLLTTMLEFCPAGLDRTLPFHYAFTQRLPQCLRTQLGEVEPGDPRALAARADKLWVVNTPSSSDSSIAATVSAEEGSVTAIRGGHKGGRGRNENHRGRGAARAATHTAAANGGTPAAANAGTPAAANAGMPAADPTPSALARVACGLCFVPWIWAEKATKCAPPCSWGN